MSEYLDVGQFRQTKNGKWRFIRLGSARKNDKGQLDVYLDALPLSDAEGGCRITITKREPREGQQAQQRSEPAGDYGDTGDEIPW